METNLAQDILYSQHASFEDRREVASVCAQNLELTIPVLLDDMADSVDRVYRGWPERIYVLSADGRIAYQGRKGPYGFDPEDLARVLRTLN